MEETLIRENATKKITKRNIPGNHIGPPVTLVNAPDASTLASNGSDDKKDFEMKNFDVVKSPMNVDEKLKLGEQNSGDSM